MLKISYFLRMYKIKFKFKRQHFEDFSFGYVYSVELNSLVICITPENSASSTNRSFLMHSKCHLIPHMKLHISMVFVYLTLFTHEIIKLVKKNRDLRIKKILLEIENIFTCTHILISKDFLFHLNITFERQFKLEILRSPLALIVLCKWAMITASEFLLTQ